MQQTDVKSNTINEQFPALGASSIDWKASVAISDLEQRRREIADHYEAGR